MSSAAPIAASQSQFTPLAGPTTSTVQTLRQTIGQVHAYRATNSAPTPPKAVETKFLVRIAHGSYEEANTGSYQVYPEAWPVRINNAIPIDYIDFMAKLRVAGLSLSLPHISARLNIDWNGK